MFKIVFLTSKNLCFISLESSVHEALYQKCCSYSSKPKVRLYGEDEQRYALVKFQRYVYLNYFIKFDFVHVL